VPYLCYEISSICYVLFGLLLSLATSKPHPKPTHQSDYIGASAFGAAQIGRRAKLAVPGDAEIRRKFAFNLVAKAKAELNLIQAGTNAPLFHFLGSCAGLDPGLSPKPLGDRKIILGFNPGREVPILADIQFG